MILGGIAQGIAHWALPSVRLLAGCSRGHCTQPYGSDNRYPLQLEFCPAAGTVTGSGTADFVPLWTSSSNIGNSVRFQSDSGPPARVGFNTSSSSATLDVHGRRAGVVRLWMEAVMRQFADVTWFALVLIVTLTSTVSAVANCPPKGGLRPLRLYTTSREPTGHVPKARWSGIVPVRSTA